MFCPKCGTREQSPESYCRNCGVWLVDPEANASIFRKSTPEQQIRKIRTLEVISIGMSLTSVAIIFAYLSAGLDRGLLFLAMTCGLVVIIYQLVNIFLGYKVTKNLPKQHRAEIPQRDPTMVLEFPVDTARQLNTPASVTDNTTELLDPVPTSNRENSA